MPKLILVKHSLPEIHPEQPANQWLLSEVGRFRCETLAERLQTYQPDIVVSSIEPKALETAQLIAKRLQKPTEIVTGLHEHERSGVGWLGKTEFEAAVKRFFDKQDRLVLGSETADQARERFTQVVDRVVARHTGQNIVMVVHGTVITLFVAQVALIEPFEFWQQLGLPSFVVIDLLHKRLQEIVNSLNTAS